MNFCLKGHHFTRIIRNIKFSKDNSLIVEFEQQDPREISNLINDTIYEAVHILHDYTPEQRHAMQNPEALAKARAIIEAHDLELLTVTKKEIFAFIEQLLTSLE